ncbi:hypothetical protein ACH4VT_25295 [Streptomyces lydicus]|uniref:hypothetical protein n=1 Tax=Streptomyces lydicus TaxID=47763 RepID=UPI003798B05C
MPDEHKPTVPGKALHCNAYCERDYSPELASNATIDACHAHRSRPMRDWAPWVGAGATIIAAVIAAIAPKLF